MNHYQEALKKLNWVEVTLWYRIIDGNIVYNHLESGHSKSDKPVPKNQSQKSSWSNGKWSKRIWFMNSSNEVLKEY